MRCPEILEIRYFSYAILISDCSERKPLSLSFVEAYQHDYSTDITHKMIVAY